MSWNNFFKAAGKALSAAQTYQRSTRNIPVMTMEMIQSNGGPITAAQAVKLFKEFAIKTGYLEKHELAEHGEYFAQEIRDEAEYLEQNAKGELEQLRYALQELQDERKEIKAHLQELKDELAEILEDAEADANETIRTKNEIAKAEAKLASLAGEIEGAKQDLAQEEKSLEPAKKAWADFKADKRQFLVQYTNRQTQGRQSP